MLLRADVGNQSRASQHKDCAIVNAQRATRNVKTD